MAKLPMYDARGGALLSWVPLDDSPLGAPSTVGHFACSLIVVEWDQRVLLGFNVRRNQWELPGGSVEKGESAHDAAIRELAEETAIRVTHALNIARAEFRFSNDATIYNAALFYVIIDQCPQLVESDELSAFRWWNPEDDLWEAMNVLDAEVVRRVTGRR